MAYTQCMDAGGGSKTFFVPLVNANTGAVANIAQLIGALP